MLKAEAIEYFGSSKNLADALNVTKGSVSQWGEEVPELRAYQIERITGGKLKVSNPPVEFKQAS
jgi:DNA-binding transcriptional regulator YdaS (Cro superfamily)